MGARRERAAAAGRATQTERQTSAASHWSAPHTVLANRNAPTPPLQSEMPSPFLGFANGMRRMRWRYSLLTNHKRASAGSTLAGSCRRIRHLFWGRVVSFAIKGSPEKGQQGRINTQWLKRSRASRRDSWRWSRRRARGPIFRPHSQWQPERAAPRGTLGGAGPGWGPARPVRGTSGAGPARPGVSERAPAAAVMVRAGGGREGPRHGGDTSGALSGCCDALCALDTDDCILLCVLFSPL